MDEPSKPPGEFVPAPGPEPARPLQTEIPASQVPLIPAIALGVLVLYLATASWADLWPFVVRTTPTLSPSHCPPPSPDPMVGYREYLDGEHCFSFQYPERVQLSDASNPAAGMLVTLNPPEGGQINVWTAPEERYQNHSTPEIIQVGGVTAQKYSYWQTGSCSGILVSFRSKGIEVSIDDCYEGGGSPTFPNQAQMDLFEQIVATFRFTN